MATPEYLKNVPGFGDKGDATASLNNRGGGGTSGGMDKLTDLEFRLARLEGGNTMLQFAVGIVSAALLAGLALLIGVQLSTQQQVSSLSDQMDDLPDEINDKIMALTTSFAEVIASARAPNVIEVRPAPPATETTQAPSN